MASAASSASLVNRTHNLIMKNAEGTIPKNAMMKFIRDCLKDKNEESTQISSEAKETIAKCTTLFLHYLTAAANEICMSEGRVTIAAVHILKATEQLEFPFKDKMTEFITKYQADVAAKRAEESAKNATVASTSSNSNSNTTTVGNKDEEKEPEEKESIDEDDSYESSEEEEDTTNKEEEKQTEEKEDEEMEDAEQAERPRDPKARKIK